jgi:hypothetical protein
VAAVLFWVCFEAVSHILVLEIRTAQTAAWWVLYLGGISMLGLASPYSRSYVDPDSAPTLHRESTWLSLPLGPAGCLPHTAVREVAARSHIGVRNVIAADVVGRHSALA